MRRKCKRNLKAVMAMLMVAVMLVGVMASGAVVRADRPEYMNPLAGKRYLADVGTGYLKYDSIKYLNVRGAFEKKRGTEYRFRPEADLKKGAFIGWVYGMYGKKLDWGNKSYQKNKSTAWQWAQSNGIISKKGQASELATSAWVYTVLDHLAGAINGGSVEVNPQYSKSSLVPYRALAASDLCIFCKLNDGMFDPRNLD